jgi:hypothetical protein
MDQLMLSLTTAMLNQISLSQNTTVGNNQALKYKELYYFKQRRDKIKWKYRARS